MASRGREPLLLAVLLLVQWSGLSDCQTNVPVGTKVVPTIDGPINGNIMEISAPTIPLTQLLVFKGVPFAAPPVGNLRFAAPQPPEKRSAVLNTMEFGPSCIQDMSSEHIAGGMSEDCLTLNIFAPLPNGTVETFPVMVWIYGGSYRSGGSALYDGSALAALGQVVVVTINYRLGALGFMSSTVRDTVAGNMGFQDQQMAMQWVSSNIELFGGNSAQVTIFGESAGAGSVNMHLISPRSWPYFKRAIAESGSALSGWAVQNKEDSTLAAQALAQGVNCLTTSLSIDLVCMRNVSAELILQKQNIVYTFWAGDGRQLPYTPVVDGEVIPYDPVTALTTGKFHTVEILTGVNHDEWGLFAMYYLTPGSAPSINETMFNKTVEAFVGNGYWGFPPAGSSKTVKDVVKFEYTDWSDPHSGEMRLQGVIQAGSDFGFFCPLQAQANYWTSPSNVANGAKLYMYQFSHVDGAYPSWVGVPHSAEILYVFGFVLMYPSIPQLPSLVIDDVDRNVSRNMISIWSSFARTGDPSNGLPSDGDVASWPLYDSVNRSYIDLSASITEDSFLHNEHCQMLGTLSSTLYDASCPSSPTHAPPPSTTAAPLPEKNCPPKKHTLLYITIVLAALLAMCLVEVFILAFRLRAAKEAANSSEVRKGLLNNF